MLNKLNLLFLCTGNSCRSQMAEGFTRAIFGEIIEPYSAGISKSQLDPRAVAVMQEVGIDISGQHSKTPDEITDVPFRDLRQNHKQRCIRLPCCSKCPSDVGKAL